MGGPDRDPRYHTVLAADLGAVHGGRGQAHVLPDRGRGHARGRLRRCADPNWFRTRAQGDSWLLLLGAGLLALAALPGFFAPAEVDSTTAAPELGTMRKASSAALRDLRSERYLRRMLILTLLSTITVTLIDFLFKAEIARSVPPTGAVRILRHVQRLAQRSGRGGPVPARSAATTGPWCRACPAGAALRARAHHAGGACGPGAGRADAPARHRWQPSPLLAPQLARGALSPAPQPGSRRDWMRARYSSAQSLEVVVDRAQELKRRGPANVRDRRLVAADEWPPFEEEGAEMPRAAPRARPRRPSAPSPSCRRRPPTSRPRPGYCGKPSAGYVARVRSG